MGLYFNSADTLKVCAKLNRRFSEDNLDQIRSDTDRRAKFENPTTNTRTLQRIAYKSGLWPTRKASNNKAKRWFKFLKDVNDGSPAVTLLIKQALADGVLAMTGSAYKYSALNFVAIEGPVLKFSTSDLEIFDAGGTRTGLVLLLCLQTVAAGTGQYDPAPVPDAGEDSAQEPNDDDDSGIDPSATAFTPPRASGKGGGKGGGKANKKKKL